MSKKSKITTEIYIIIGWAMYLVGLPIVVIINAYLFSDFGRLGFILDLVYSGVCLGLIWFGTIKFNDTKNAIVRVAYQTVLFVLLWIFVVSLGGMIYSSMQN